MNLKYLELVWLLGILDFLLLLILMNLIGMLALEDGFQITTYFLAFRFDLI